jgi:predicted SAM-dependent methyltransferase
MIETIEFNNKSYPAFQAQGHASQFAIPYALQVCKGRGYDIGCMKREWSFPGSHAIDLSFDDMYDANNLPERDVDYIFSSHCLEHIDNWVETMEYWHSCLRQGGVLFLYLPDYSQEYWRPWNNKKHRNMFSPTIMKDCMQHLGYHKIFTSGPDLNNAFMIMGEKV